MFRTPRTRVAALLVLLAALFGLLVWHGTLDPAPAVWDLPGNADVADSPGRYLGERVDVGGRVVATDPLVVLAEYGVDSSIRLRIVGLDPSVSVAEGATLRVYGVLEADRRVRSLDAFAVPAWGRWYTWSISFLAGLWVLARIVRHFRFDVAERALVRREETLGLRWLPGGRSDRRGERDA